MTPTKPIEIGKVGMELPSFYPVSLFVLLRHRLLGPGNTGPANGALAITVCLHPGQYLAFDKQSNTQKN
jgi:hypothetical protein